MVSTKSSPAKAVNTKRRWAAAAVLGIVATAGGLVWLGQGSTAPAKPPVIVGDGIATPADMAWIPPGVFQMGSDSKLAQANEKPAHAVQVGGFWMDTVHVTNDQFAEFVRQTGYVTTAERKPDWETIRVQLPPGIPRPPDDVLVPGAMVFVGTN